MGNHLILVRGRPEENEKFKRLIGDITVMMSTKELTGCDCTGNVGIKPHLREVRLYDMSAPDSLRETLEKNFLSVLHSEMPFKVPNLLLKFINGYEPFKYDRPKQDNVIGQPGMLNTGVHVLGWKRDAYNGVVAQNCATCKKPYKQILL